MMETKSSTFSRRFSDIAIVSGLTSLAWLFAWAWPHIVQRQLVAVSLMPATLHSLYTQPLTYVLLAAVFLPLALSRKYPLMVLVAAAVLSSTYGLFPYPPAPTIVAPLTALFIVGTVRDRRTVWIAFIAVTTFTIAMSAGGNANERWLPDTIVIAALFTVAASLGDAARNRRAYVAAVEQRAIDAERTREDEAQRRVEEERLHIARELHDVTAHSLSIIALQAGAAEKAVTRDPDAAVRALQTIRTTSRESLDELRAMLGVLRSADEDAPLSPAGRLERLPELVRTAEDAGLRMKLDVSANVTDIPAYADVSAFRIVQEAITNVVRHARATSVDVVLRREGDALLIVVTDDGRGVLPGQGTEGHGLAGMRERTAALGGTFEAGPLDGGGFRVSARLPLVSGAQRRDR